MSGPGALWVDTAVLGALPGVPLGRLLVAGFVFAMALALMVLATRSLLRRDRARYGPTCRRVCSSLGIRDGERRLLERLARRAGVPSAATLLISRGSFEAAVARHGVGKTYAETLSSIRRKVFE